MNSIIPRFSASIFATFWAIKVADIRVKDNLGISGGTMNLLAWFFQEKYYKFGIFKLEFSKPSIICQHSRVDRPNWQKFEWRMFKGEPGTMTSFCFG